jgi:hypothetical protein
VVTYMGEPLRWNHLVSFFFLVAAVYFVFGFRPVAPVENKPAGMSTSDSARSRPAH